MSEKPKDRPRSKKIKALSILIGVALGVACSHVPPEYRAACNAIADITTTPGCL